MKKKYLVIGNPIDHSLSPKLHNYWIKKNKVNAIYDKKLLKKEEIKSIIYDIRDEKIHGINVTVPFKKSVIPFIDELSMGAKESQSVNTIYKNNKGKIIGENTDIVGFELGARSFQYNIKNKKIFILGAGGVVSSIILALKKMKVSKILVSNRTEKKAIDLKNIFPDIEIIEWGKIPDFDVIINATSIGLKKNEKIQIDFENIDSGKFFYDIIYNPFETDFLKKAKKFGHQIENGKMMFIYQAHQAFAIWHKIFPKIDDQTIKIVQND